MAKKFGLWAMLVVSAACGLLSQACSERSCVDSRTCSPSLAESAGSAGASGSAGLAGSAGSDLSDAEDAGNAGNGPTAPACTTDADCDDQLRCNGSETCLAGACQEGVATQCQNAATCVEGTSASACTYPDPSAWLVYDADEDTPALGELYAVKEALIGAQQPIKISAPLSNAPSERLAPHYSQWSADGRWLMFGTTEEVDTAPTRYYAVRFDRGIPEAPIALTAALPPVSYMSWSPTGHELLFRGSEGSLYWLHPSDAGMDPPVRLGALSHVAGNAIWATTSTVVYTINGNAAYQVPVRANPPAPLQFTGSDSTSRLELGWASPDGAWVVFITDGRSWSLANVALANIQPLAKDAIYPSEVSWQFSPDSRYLVYAASQQVASQTELYLVDLWNSSPVRTIEITQLARAGYSLGSWAPDSSFFTYFGDPSSREPSERSLNVFDLATKQSSGTNYDVGLDDRAVGFSPDSTRILYSTRWSTSSTSTDLVGIDREGGEQNFDVDTAGRPYTSAEFAANGLAALYCTTFGSDRLVDMVYSDRRPLGGRAVRVPGEGSVYSCSKGFAPDSKGFAYYRFAPDGARTLYWVDITKQVMTKPVQISREGRVQTYAWQPVAKATN